MFRPSRTSRIRSHSPDTSSIPLTPFSRDKVRSLSLFASVSCARSSVLSDHRGSAKGAKQFAIEKGLELAETEDLLVGRELERLKQLQQDPSFHPKDSFTGSQSASSSEPSPKIKGQGMGTVGCVCMDQTGFVAVAVSTGGTPFKRSGRVCLTSFLTSLCFDPDQISGIKETDAFLRLVTLRSGVRVDMQRIRTVVWPQRDTERIFTDR